MMHFKKIITFLILLLVVQFLLGCNGMMRPAKTDYMPFDGFGPDGRSKRAYEAELDQTRGNRPLTF